MFEIETGIPIPDAKTSGRYPCARMKVGESFFVPKTKPAQVCPTVNYWKRTTGFTFTCRTINGGVRVWRIK